MGEIHRRFWNCKKVLAKGAETANCRLITSACKDLIHGEVKKSTILSSEQVPNLFSLQSLAGAGGGGFMVLFTKSPNSKQEIEDALKKQNLNFPVYDVEIDRRGLQVKIGDEIVNLS